MGVRGDGPERRQDDARIPQTEGGDPAAPRERPAERDTAEERKRPDRAAGDRGGERSGERRRWTAPRGVAFWFVALAFAVTMLGTTMPTPLYVLYQRQLGFSTLMTTVVYAVYAVGVLTALLLFGQLSDTIGRRRALLPGLACSVLSAVVFLCEGGLPALFVGRVLSGLSAGIFTGTATAALVDLATSGGRRASERATLVATAVNTGGLGSGPLMAGLVAEFGPWPLRLPFVVDLGLLAVAAFGVWTMPEPVRLESGGGRPRLSVARPRVPAGMRGTFVRAAIAGFAGFAVLGLFTAVAPSFLGTVLGVHDLALSGALVFTVFAASTVGQAALVPWLGGRSLPVGCAVLIAGMGLLAGALIAASAPLLVLAAVVAGLGQGLTFRAGLSAINAQAPADQRGAVASTFFVVCYVALSLPVVGEGVAADAIGLRDAGVAFTVAVAVLAAGVLVSLLRGAGTGRGPDAPA